MKRESASNHRKPHLEKPMRKHIAFCLGDTDFDIVVGGTDASYIAPNSMGFGHPVPQTGNT